MKASLLLLGVSVLSLEPTGEALAQQVSEEITEKVSITSIAKSFQSMSVSSATQPLLVKEVPYLHDRPPSNTSAKALLDEFPLRPQPLLPIDSSAIAQIEEDTEEEVIVEGQQQKRSTPEYVVTEEEIKKQGNRSVAEVLRSLPGFAINDVGFGADIHTGSYYRGSSINQSVFLVNGRSIGSNINTYHGTTDLNSIPVETIERIEVSSGTSSTLYGSEAFGGVVNIITKQSAGTPKFNGLVQYGSLGQENYRGSYRGSVGSVNYSFGYEQYQADNRYRVPVGAANRGTDGRLFNGDQARNNYSGQLGFQINPRNTLTLDAFKTTSRKGLLYFGFPLQRDRLNHDALNIGLNWRSQLGAGKDSTLSTTIGFNQDYFNTFGPTQNIFYRQGTLDSKALTARVEHDWQLAANNNLRWGVDIQNQHLTGDVLSTVSRLAALNGTEERDRLNTALFARNTWSLTPTLLAEVGLRQNFNSEFGSALNPSAGLRWGVSPSLALRGSWASVRRLPGLDQLYVFDTVHGWLPNPDLEPETGSSWTAGVDVQFSRGLTGQFTYFGSRLNDRLGITNGRWTNIGLVNTNGAEVGLRWQVSRQWSTFVNYTYTDARIATGTEKGLQLGELPFSVGQMGIGYESNGWQVNLYANYFSGARRALFTRSTDSPLDFSPSWLNVDLSARIPVAGRLGLLLYLENLGGVSYEKANRIYQPGLTFRVGLTSDF